MKNIKKIKVSNLTSPRSGRKIANQFEITTNDGRYFQSYSTVIVFISNDGKTYLDQKDWDCSRTTSKYRRIFLGEGINQTREKIELGEYTLTNLN